MFYNVIKQLILIGGLAVFMLSGYSVDAQTTRRINMFTTTPRSMEGKGLVGEYLKTRECNFMLSKMRRLPLDRQDIYYTDRYSFLCREPNAKAIKDGFETMKIQIRNELREKHIKAEILDYKAADQINYRNGEYARKIAEVDKVLYEVLKDVKIMDVASRTERRGANQNQQSGDDDFDADAGFGSNSDSNTGFRVIKNMAIVTEDRLRGDFKTLHQTITDQNFRNRRGKLVEGRLIVFTDDTERKRSEPGGTISNIFSHFFQIDPPEPGETWASIYFRIFLYDLEQTTDGKHPLYFKKTDHCTWHLSAPSYMGCMQRDFQLILEDFTSH